MTVLASVFKHRVSLLLPGNLLLEDVVVVFDDLLGKLVCKVILIGLFFLFEVLGHFLFEHQPVELLDGVGGEHFGLHVHSRVVLAVVQLFINQLPH